MSIVEGFVRRQWMLAVELEGRRRHRRIWGPIKGTILLQAFVVVRDINKWTMMRIGDRVSNL
jgi:hypothetical protein